jgi:hypothetical protein
MRQTSTKGCNSIITASSEPKGFHPIMQSVKSRVFTEVDLLLYCCSLHDHPNLKSLLTNNNIFLQCLKPPYQLLKQFEVNTKTHKIVKLGSGHNSYSEGCKSRYDGKLPKGCRSLPIFTQVQDLQSPSRKVIMHVDFL